MRLMVQTDYALRMLMHLAMADDRLVTINEVAARYDISKNHLMKVSQALVAHGAIASVRGRGGGLKLASSPDNILVGPLVRKLEMSSALVACFPGGEGGCVVLPACRLKSVLANAQEAFFAVLDRVSLADLTGGNAELRAILTGEAA